MRRDISTVNSLVVVNEEGLPDFDELQNNLTPDYIIYYAFEFRFGSPTDI
jgi:hypothetical protein